MPKERNRYLLKPLPPEAITLPPLPDHIENPLDTSGQGDTSSALLSPEKAIAKTKVGLTDGQPFADAASASDSELVAQREVRRLKLTKIGVNSAVIVRWLSRLNSARIACVLRSKWTSGGSSGT